MGFEQLDDGIGFMFALLVLGNVSKGATELTVALEPVEGDLSILTDLDKVAVGITHVAAPFPAMIV